MLVFVVPAPGQILDGFHYGSDRAARTAWRAIGTSPPASAAGDGLRLALPFREDRDRVYWDRKVSLDLSRATSFELELSCDHPEALRHLGVYFKSGGGWYIANPKLTTPGRTTLSLATSDFSTEGRPAGWQSIETIRFSPWKGSSVNAALTLHALRARQDRVLLVRATTSAPDAAERNFAKRVTLRASRWLTDAGISHGVIDDGDLAAGRIGRASLLILCYNPQPTPAELTALRAFLKNGGRLVVFYSSSEELARLLGMKLGSYARTNKAGRWSSILFSDPEAWNVPARITQESMNIRPVHPATRGARVVAYWADGRGRRSGDPAWTVSETGAWMSHVLLEGDAPGKRRMLVGLVGHFVPGFYAEAARHAVATVGRVGDYRGYDEAVALLRGDRDDTVQGLVQRAEVLRERMARFYENGQYREALNQALKVDEALAEAYARTRQPLPGEFRGVWEHDGVGWYPGDWEATCSRLAAAGINAILPNMLWGGLAHYPSKVLPPSTTYRRYGDQVKQCLDAAHRHGMEMHVWTVCWNLQGTPDSFRKRMRKEGRVIIDKDGTPTDWLNPAHRDNMDMVLNSLREVVEQYPVDGIHLDYVRYPSSAVDYSEATRKAFAAWRGQPVTGWPHAVERGGSLRGAYERFRADQINLFVRGVHKQIRPLRPGLKVSAAVFRSYPECVATVGQDWALWVDKGYVDFVVPMNYTGNTAELSEWTKAQLALPGARGRVYPGIGVTANESELRPDQAIAQILAGRRLGAKGFVLFDLSQTLRDEILPALALGTTRTNQPPHANP
jgi:uncharacterized lipoprotein YddW (UPF0748 family)